MPEIVCQRLIHPVTRLPLVRQPQRVQERRADRNIRDFANLAGLTHRLEDFGVLLMIRLCLAADERFRRCNARRTCTRRRMRGRQRQHQRKRQGSGDGCGMARQMRKRRVDLRADAAVPQPADPEERPAKQQPAIRIVVDVDLPSSRPGLGRFLLRRLGARLGLVAGSSAVLASASLAVLLASSRSSFSSIRASISPLSAGIHSTVASEVRGIQRISSWRSCFWGSSDSLASEQ